MRNRVLDNLMLTCMIGLALTVVLFVALRDEFNSRPNTVENLYSIVVEALATLLGLMLVVLQLGHGRNARLRRELSGQLESLTMKLVRCSPAIKDINDCDVLLRSWHYSRYPILCSAATKLKADVGKGSLGRDILAAYDEIDREALAYQRAGRRLGRFYEESKLYKGFPKQIAFALILMLTTILLSVVMLAGLDSLIDAVGSDTFWLTIPISSLFVLSILPLAVVTSGLLRILSKETHDLWFDQSGLPRIGELESTLKQLEPCMRQTRTALLAE